MFPTLLLLFATAAHGDDCTKARSCSLMDLLNDMERATQSRHQQVDDEDTDDPVEPVTPEEPVVHVQPEQLRAYVSSEQDYAPVQIAASGIPRGSSTVRWKAPSAWTWRVAFSGTPGRKANHEGTDYVHDDQRVAEVPVSSMADGEVVYVRMGCPQSSAFGKNRSARECGSGWGNHVVVDHGDGVYVRYAHLDPQGITVGVGDRVTQGQELGLMGNSGRSETRHLHYELGTRARGFDPSAPSQSFDAVYDPEQLPVR